MFRRYSSDWGWIVLRGVNWSVTLASCSGRLWGGPSSSMLYAATGRIIVTNFVAGRESCSPRSDAVAKRSSSGALVAFKSATHRALGVAVCCDERSQAAVTIDRSPAPKQTDTALPSVQPRSLSDKLYEQAEQSAMSP